MFCSSTAYLLREQQRCLPANARGTACDQCCGLLAGLCYCNQRASALDSAKVLCYSELTARGWAVERVLVVLLQAHHVLVKCNLPAYNQACDSWWCMHFNSGSKA